MVFIGNIFFLIFQFYLFWNLIIHKFYNNIRISNYIKIKKFYFKLNIISDLKSNKKIL